MGLFSCLSTVPTLLSDMPSPPRALFPAGFSVGLREGCAGTGQATPMHVLSSALPLAEEDLPHLVNGGGYTVKERCGVGVKVV